MVIDFSLILASVSNCLLIRYFMEMKLLSWKWEPTRMHDDEETHDFPFETFSPTMMWMTGLDIQIEGFFGKIKWRIKCFIWPPQTLGYKSSCERGVSGSMFWFIM